MKKIIRAIIIEVYATAIALIVAIKAVGDTRPNKKEWEDSKKIMRGWNQDEKIRKREANKKRRG